MTQEDKELLLKDLCARLPYGVKIVIQDTFKYSIVSQEYHVLDVSNFSDIFCFNYKKFDKRMKKAMREHPNDIVIKPYLFPLSSITEEQKSYINGRWGVNEHFEFEIDPLWGEYFVDVCDAVDFINWCYENHFDINGLIPRGLAEDATDKNIY